MVKGDTSLPKATEWMLEKEDGVRWPGGIDITCIREIKNKWNRESLGERESLRGGQG
jgi:hypothetical protein